MRWAVANFDRLLDLLWQHTWISAMAIGLGFLMALPVGWAAYTLQRSTHSVLRRLSGVIISASSLLYTIPPCPSSSSCPPFWDWAGSTQ